MVGSSTSCADDIVGSSATCEAASNCSSSLSQSIRYMIVAQGINNGFHTLLTFSFFMSAIHLFGGGGQDCEMLCVVTLCTDFSGVIFTVTGYWRDCKVFISWPSKLHWLMIFVSSVVSRTLFSIISLLCNHEIS